MKRLSLSRCSAPLSCVAANIIAASDLQHTNMPAMLTVVEKIGKQEEVNPDKMGYGPLIGDTQKTTLLCMPKNEAVPGKCQLWYRSGARETK